MNSPRTVEIVGGGLAGLVLGIGLRQRGVPVTLREAGRYPRHRVCGEFICGRGQRTLERLGLRGLLERAGMEEARTAMFFTARRAGRRHELPEPGWCLSRHDMDGVLADHFRGLGGELRESQRAGAEPGEGRVRATGRRSGRDGWFGLKAHVRGIEVEADLEMHVSGIGYVGLCRINRGEINVCGLFRKDAAKGMADRYELLLGADGSALRGRMAGAEWIAESRCAVAGLAMTAHRAGDHPEICVGDAIAMIPPVTGNGMSMAMESAEIAAPLLEQWSRGALSWETARATVARECDARFARRLKWAARLQRALLTEPWQRLLVAAADSERLWRMGFQLTR